MNEKSVELFQNFQAKNDAMYDWTDAQLMTLTQMMSIVNYKEYETLMSVGEEASWLGFLLDGELTVLNEDQIEIATLKPGCIVGEMSLFESGTRNATLIGKDGHEGTIGVLRFDQFDDMWNEEPEISYKLLSAVAADAILKLRNSLDAIKATKKGKSNRRCSEIRKVGSMRRISSVDGEKWNKLAKTEIIYRSKMNEMKSKEQDASMKIKSLDTKNIDLEMSYRNEKILRIKSQKKVKRLNDEIKVLEQNLEEYKQIEEAMMLNRDGKKAQRLKQTNAKLQAQADSARQQTQKWKAKAIQTKEDAEKYRRASMEWKERYVQYESKMVEIQVERDTLRKQIKLHEQLKGEHASVSRELNTTLDRLTESTQKEAKLRMELLAQKNYHNEIEKKHSHAKSWMRSLVKRLCHKILCTYNLKK